MKLTLGEELKKQAVGQAREQLEKLGLKGEVLDKALDEVTRQLVGPGPQGKHPLRHELGHIWFIRTFWGAKALHNLPGAADKAAHVERVSGDKVNERQANLHPDQAAKEMAGGDEGLVEEVNVAARACECDGQHQGGGDVGERSGEGEDELGASLAGALLAFRVGVGKEAADGQQQHGAQAQAEPGGDDEARGFSYHDRANKNEKQHKAAAQSFFLPVRSGAWSQ